MRVHDMRLRRNVDGLVPACVMTRARAIKPRWKRETVPLGARLYVRETVLPPYGKVLEVWACKAGRHYNISEVLPEYVMEELKLLTRAPRPAIEHNIALTA
jgi:hypothetical protein